MIPLLPESRPSIHQPVPQGDDGNPDTFRIKIWYEEDGGEVVVYDNGSQQSLGGGSIVVHNK